MFCDAGHPDAHDLDNGLIRGMTHPIGRITSLPNTCARWPLTPSQEGGKKDRARHVFRQHGFHAGPRASLPSLLVCPIAFPQFGRMGWPFSGVSTRASGQAKGSGHGDPKCLAPIASPRGRGKKNHARHVFGQHGFHAGPRASLPHVSQLNRPGGGDGTLVAGFPGGRGLGIERGVGTVRHLGDLDGHAPARADDPQCPAPFDE